MKNNRRDFLRKLSVFSAGLTLSPVFAFTQNNSFSESVPLLPTIKPLRLKPGDKVAITSPAGALWDQGKTVNNFTRILNQFGFEVIHGNSLRQHHGYFSGTDEQRANELNSLFANKDIKGIFCAKGGWGCARLLDKIDYSLIRNNPKVLIGFSDISVLLNAIFAKTGMITFHGPVGNSGWNEFSSDSFRSVVMNAEKVDFPKDTEAPVTLHAGVCKGQLAGGNLTVLCAIIGSGFLPDFKNKILFLEEAHEEPYSIDRMLTQLKLAGVLEAVSGIVFGRCTSCEAEEPGKSFTLEEVLRQHFEPLGIPVMLEAMTGHIENKWTLPVGAQAELDTAACRLRLLESAVQ